MHLRLAISEKQEVLRSLGDEFTVFVHSDWIRDSVGYGAMITKWRAEIQCTVIARRTA